MKKSFFILTVLFFTSYLFSMGSKNQRNFVKGNLIDKTEAVKAASEVEIVDLAKAAIEFSLNYKEILGDDSELSALAISGITALPVEYIENSNMTEKNLISEKLIGLYLTDDFHEVYVVYTEFHSAAVQEPKCVRLLPLLRRDFLDVEREGDKNAQMIFEPSIEVVFDQLVYQYVTGFMYDVFMQSAASENIARMNAMQSATRNADDMIKHLSTELNAARQLQITNEITEISAAVEMGGI